MSVLWGISDVGGTGTGIGWEAEITSEVTRGLEWEGEDVEGGLMF